MWGMANDTLPYEICLGTSCQLPCVVPNELNHKRIALRRLGKLAGNAGLELHTGCFDGFLEGV